MARGHGHIKESAQDSWYYKIDPDEPYKCELQNLGQYASSLIDEFNLIYNYFKVSFSEEEWNFPGYKIYDPITELDTEMWDYAKANPISSYDADG